MSIAKSYQIQGFYQSYNFFTPKTYLFSFDFLTDEKEDEELKEFADSFAEEIDNLSDREKVEKIHDKILDIGSYAHDTKEVNGLSVHSPYSLLKEGQGVCQAYSSLFQIMCDRAGLESRVVVGTTPVVTEDGDSAHAWNEVYLDGQWLGVDTTWNDGAYESGLNKYEYYLRDLSQDHFREEY